MFKSSSRPTVCIFTLLLVLALVFVSACGSSGSATTTAASSESTVVTSTPTSSETTSTSEASGDQPVLKIGAVCNLSDPGGIEIKKWLDLIAKMYNSEGGWDIGGTKYRVEAAVYDSGTFDPTKTRTAVEKAVLQDGVKYIVTTFGDINSVTASITEPNKVVMLGFDVTDQVATPDFNYTFHGCGLIFSQALHYAFCTDAIARGATTYLSVCPDNAQGKVIAEQTKAIAALSGLEPLDSVFVPADTLDFRSVATKIMSLNPGFVESPSTPMEQSIAFISALKDAGYKGVIGAANLASPDSIDKLVAKVGKEYVEGMLIPLFDSRAALGEDSAMRALEDAYIEEYGTWKSDGENWLASWFLFQDAVNQVQSTDPDKIVDYLHDSKQAVKTLLGYVQLFARPDLENPRTIEASASYEMAVIKDGKMTATGKTVSVKDNYLVSIPVLGATKVYQEYWAKYGKPTFPDEPSTFDFSDLPQ